jgi:SAM-dependent methyltransferase
MIASPKVSYLLRAIRDCHKRERSNCPSCGSNSGTPVQRKFLFTRLVRCASCRLLYRAPTDPPELYEDFYQHDYREGYTTDCPSREDLQALLNNRFIGSQRDYSTKIAFIRALGVPGGARVLDYGASWGYGTWQLRESGYDTTGYEIGRPRARYAREIIGLPVYDSFEKIRGPFDVFFSSHVLEHITKLRDLISLALKLLRPNGVFLAFTPNGCRERTSQSENNEEYRHIWGLAHPVLIDAEFYHRAFAGRPKLLCTSPYNMDEIGAWNKRFDLALNLEGNELAVAVLK